MSSEDKMMEQESLLGSLGSFVKHGARPPRFVQVHGASGSGKTTLVKALMATPEWQPTRDVASDFQKRPIAQVLCNAPIRPLLLVGHYYVGCGGADTLKHRELPYRIAREALDRGYDVLLEGIFVSLELHRVVDLQNDGYDRHNVFLDVPMEVCEESVQLRRDAAGTPRRPLKQMADTHPRIMRTYDRMAQAGLPNLYLPFSPAESGLENRDLDYATFVRGWAEKVVRGLFTLEPLS